MVQDVKPGGVFMPVIQVEAEGGILAGNPFALNDIAVLKRDDASN